MLQHYQELGLPQEHFISEIDGSLVYPEFDDGITIILLRWLRFWLHGRHLDNRETQTVVASIEEEFSQYKGRFSDTKKWFDDLHTVIPSDFEDAYDNLMKYLNVFPNLRREQWFRVIREPGSTLPTIVVSTA